MTCSECNNETKSDCYICTLCLDKLAKRYENT